MRAARPSARKLRGNFATSAIAASESPPRYSNFARAKAASAFFGSSSSALRSDASSPASSSVCDSDGTSPSKKRSTSAEGFAPTNSATIEPFLNAFTAGMPWILKSWEMRGFSSVSIFASTTLPSRFSAAFSSAGPSWRHGPHQGAQKSTTTGSSLERSSTSAAKVVLGHVDHGHAATG